MFDDLHDPDPPTATANHLANVAERAERRRRRRTATAMGAVAAVLVAGGATALALRDPDSGPTTTLTAPPTSPTIPGQEPTTTPPTTAAAPAPITTAATLVTTSAPHTSPSPTTAPTLSIAVNREPGQPAPPELVTLAATIAERARNVSSFGGTVEHIQGAPAQPVSTTTRLVALRADGSMWTTDDVGGWASFDAASGITRMAFRLDAAEEFQYQEIVGWNDNFTGEQVMLGFPPLIDVAGLTGEITISEAPYPAIPERMAWRIEQHDGLGTPLGGDSATMTSDLVYWVDQATGITLAVDRTHTSTSDGSAEVTDQTSQLTTFATDVDFPPEWPGAFPDGATVARSGDPAAFTSAMTDADLLLAFGDGLLVPDVATTGRQIEVWWQSYGSDGLPVRDAGTASTVAFTIHRGFERTSVRVERSQVAAPTEGAVVVGEVAGGALDGLPIYPDGQGGHVVFSQHNGEAIVVTVSAPTVAGAAELLSGMYRPTG